MLSTRLLASGAHFACILMVMVSLSGCGHFVSRELKGVEAPVLDDYTFVGDKSPCYLELQKGEEALRVNCFHIDGILHIHSSRWSNLPRFSEESWSISIQRAPDVRVEIAGKIYPMKATWIDDETQRQAILHDRGYLYAWRGIRVFKFLPPDGET